MARKKKEVQVEEVKVVITETLVINTLYKVKSNFEANINNRSIIASKGESVSLNDFEYGILKRFLE